VITFRKGEAVKFIDEGSVVIPVLRADGWVADGEVEVEETPPPRRGRPPKVQEID
jgi:hypothetical protein